MYIYLAEIWCDEIVAYETPYSGSHWEGYFISPALAEAAIAVQQAKIAPEGAWNEENIVRRGSFEYAARIIKIWVEDGTKNPDPFHQEAKVKCLKS